MNTIPAVTQQEPGHLCPVCRVALVMADRQNVEIDYCPKCRGVWLDRGELDKIIERSVTEVAPAARDSGNRDTYSARPESRSGHGSSQSHGGHGGHSNDRGNYRRKSWLGELFD